ncbi:MAG: hypothetical protein LBC59_04580 [Chitinispirillales bacterium]|jgi:Fic family protein|nr:hypothetical protein [Chitinispirillales bacterium]
MKKNKRADFLDYDRLNELRAAAIEKRKQLPDVVWDKFEKAFIIEYTHHSTAIEGNTLSLAEVKLVLEDGISVGGEASAGDLRGDQSRESLRVCQAIDL